MTLSRTGAAALVVSAVLGLAACGADEQPTPPTAPTSGGSGPAASGPASAGASSSVPPPAATTPVPPPTPGDTASTVAPRPVETRRPVRLDQPATPADAVTVRLTRLRAIQAKAQGPGEVSGPGLEVRVEVRNDTQRPLDLSTASVTLAAADDSPGQLMSGPPSDPLPGAVAAGRAATGTYVFTVAKSRREPVKVVVTVTGEDPVVAFSGNAPR